MAPAFERGWYYSRMRLPRLYWAMLAVDARWQASRTARLLGTFRPEAILTIHDGFGWLTAAKLAQRLRVPLHLIMHDDWQRNIPMAEWLKPRFEETFGSIYRSAASRLCISPYMVEDYARRFQATGTVLYPIRDSKAPHHTAPPDPAAATAPLKVAFAGNLWHQGNWQSLRILADALATIGGRLLIFGPTTPVDTARNGLTQSNVVVRGFVPDLIQSLRSEADVVFVPMTFQASEKRNMEICFPSKLVEYSATGLPLLIQGPEYGSAIRWSREHKDAAELVTAEDVAAFLPSLQRLQDTARRLQLGRRSLELGWQCFAFENGVRIFRESLRIPRQLSPAPL
jgi:hypothetical protein